MPTRLAFAVTAMTLAILMSARFTEAQSLSHLFESKDHYTGPVATKLAEFKEDFYPSALAFNGDGSQLAVNFMVASDGVHVWNWRDPKGRPRILAFPGGTGDGYALSYSPDGKVLAVRHNFLDDGRVIRVWNAETGELVCDVMGEKNLGSANGMAFSPDGQLLVLAMDRLEPRIVDQLLVFRTDTWELARVQQTTPFESPVIAFSPDGKLLALAGHGPYEQYKEPPKKKFACGILLLARLFAPLRSRFPAASPHPLWPGVLTGCISLPGVVPVVFENPTSLRRARR